MGPGFIGDVASRLEAAVVAALAAVSQHGGTTGSERISRVHGRKHGGHENLGIYPGLGGAVADVVTDRCFR